MAISEVNLPSLKRVTLRCSREDKIGFMVADFVVIAASCVKQVGLPEKERNTRLWPSLEDAVPALNPCF